MINILNIPEEKAQNAMTTAFQNIGRLHTIKDIQEHNPSIVKNIIETEKNIPIIQTHKSYMLIGCPGFYYSQPDYICAGPVLLEYLDYHLTELVKKLKTKEIEEGEVAKFGLPFLSSKNRYWSLFGNLDEPAAYIALFLSETGESTPEQKKVALISFMSQFIKTVNFFHDKINNYDPLKSLEGWQQEAIKKSFRLHILGDLAEEYFSYCFSWLFRDLAVFSTRHFYTGNPNDLEEYAIYNSANGDIVLTNLSVAQGILKDPAVLNNIYYRKIDLKLGLHISSASLSNFSQSIYHWYVLFSNNGSKVYFVRAVTIAKYIKEHNIHTNQFSLYDVSDFIEEIDEYQKFISEIKTI